MKLFNPEGTARPASKHSHGALVAAGGERLSGSRRRAIPLFLRNFRVAK